MNLRSTCLVAMAFIGLSTVITAAQEFSADVVYAAMDDREDHREVVETICFRL